MKQPVVKIEKDSIDNLLEAVGALAVFINIILAVTWYGDLPDTIPNHFGPDGEPDAFGSKTYCQQGGSELQAHNPTNPGRPSRQSCGAMVYPS